MRWVAAGLAALAWIAVSGPVAGQAKNRAPGFEAIPKASTIAVMPVDIELFEISAGGVIEPRADWTEAASRHFRAALERKKRTLGVRTVELGEKDADEVAEINALHAAVARSISLHHFGPGFLNLPTKEGRLDWSLGEPVREIRRRTGADYALFTWIRDSYASGERIATMIVFALLGVGLGGGAQVGYASLVDLDTGQVLWFNRLLRATGDLREADKAAETVEALLADFPGTK
jgi:hypothetical protein